MKTGGLRLGEKILFGITAAFVLFAVVSFIGMEIYRAHSGKKMYAVTSHFDLPRKGSPARSAFAIWAAPAAIARCATAPITASIWTASVRGAAGLPRRVPA